MTYHIVDFQVNKADLRDGSFARHDVESLADGQALLTVDSFAFTSNNVTYAVFGDAMQYWHFFPAAEGQGRVPVWGFGTVSESKADGIETGRRVYGYFPMSNQLVIEPTKLSNSSFFDGVSHRAKLHDVYNQYTFVDKDPLYRPDLEPQIMLFRPLFTTSFLIDDFIGREEFFGAQTVVLSSASSKTSIGLAFCLFNREGNRPTVVGLTSSGNADFVKQLGCYDTVVSYEDIGLLPEEPAVFVDMAGNGAVLNTVHNHYKDNLKYSCLVGGTHWEARDGAGREALPGPEPALFFAPDHVKQRMSDWGPAGFQTRLAETWNKFVPHTKDWVNVKRGEGEDAVRQTYLEVLDGKADPKDGFILSL